jgi:hypothetical protein
LSDNFLNRVIVELHFMSPKNSLVEPTQTQTALCQAFFTPNLGDFQLKIGLAAATQDRPSEAAERRGDRQGGDAGAARASERPSKQVTRPHA